MAIRAEFSIFLVFSLVFLGQPLSAESFSFENSLGMAFVKIEAGSFFMGADGFDPSEGPRHKIQISEPFYISTHEVSQKVFLELTGFNPSRFEDPECPVERLSWPDVFNFIVLLNAHEDTAGYGVPTEAQWEYAARGGTDGERFFAGGENLEDYAWFKDNSETRTWPVGQKKPNPFGLYDVYGNVWEWVMDWYNRGYYTISPEIDPAGPRSGISKVIRGGAYYNSGDIIRSSLRFPLKPDLKFNSVGMRVIFKGDPAERGIVKGGKNSSK